MRYLIPLLLCLSCSAPHRYMDGAPMRPPAPIVVEPGFTPPGTGLPEYWVPPEHKPPDVQPQPKPTRRLPQTPASRKGPGIWAGDGPRMSEDLPPVLPKGSPVPSISILDVPIDLAAEVRDGMEATPLAWCAHLVGLSAADHSLGMPARLASTSRNTRMCAIRAAVFMCLYGMKEGLIETMFGFYPPATFDDDSRAILRHRLKDLLRETEHSVRTSCLGVDPDVIDNLASPLTVGEKPKGGMPWKQ